VIVVGGAGSQLPSGFHPIRHYGLFASVVRAHNIETARHLWAAPECAPTEADQGLVDVFDGLDEMGLTEDEIRRVRLVYPDRSELHGHLLAPAVDECRSFSMNYLPTKWEAVHRHPPHGGL
jgi:hypothetical protein